MPFPSFIKKNNYRAHFKNYLQGYSIALASCILTARLQRSESPPSSACFIFHLHPDVELLFELLFSLGNCSLLGIPGSSSWWGESSGAEESEEFNLSIVTAGEGRGAPGGGLGGLEGISGDLSAAPLEFNSNLVQLLLPVLLLAGLASLLAL